MSSSNLGNQAPYLSSNLTNKIVFLKIDSNNYNNVNKSTFEYGHHPILNPMSNNIQNPYIKREMQKIMTVSY